jgi:hypothetical protein
MYECRRPRGRLDLDGPPADVFAEELDGANALGVGGARAKWLEHFRQASRHRGGAAFRLHRARRFGDLYGLGTAVAGTTVPGVPRRIRPPGARAQRRERTSRRPLHPSQRPTRPRDKPAVRCRHRCHQHPAQGGGPTVRTCFSENLSASQSSGASSSTAGEAIMAVTLRF